MTISIFVGSLLAAMALGIPISFALLVCGAALMVYLGMFDAQILAQNVIHGADSYPLLAVPFFLLAGELMNVGGLSKRIVNVALVLVGHIRGGLGYVTIVAACLLAALSGSAIADAAALSTMLLPMMVAAGYDKGRSAGLIASAGIIAPVVPPSIGFVIFGVAANVSISKLFFAGIFPALMLAATLWVTWWWLARKETMAAPPRKSLARGAQGHQGGCLGAGAAGDHHRRPEDGRVHAHRGRRRRRRLRPVRLDRRLPRAQALPGVQGLHRRGADQRGGDVPGRRPRPSVPG